MNVKPHGKTSNTSTYKLQKLINPNKEIKFHAHTNATQLVVGAILAQKVELINLLYIHQNY
jgi:hypothetical protein